MTDTEPKKDAAENTPPESATAPAPAPSPRSGTAPVSFPPTRPPYVPQFTAATQMILKRMKGEPSSLSAALSQVSRAPSVTASIPSTTYDDVKRRLVMGMNTSTTQMTMQMPAPARAQPQPATVPVVPVATAARPASSKAGMSAIRKVTAGLTASSKPTPIKTTVTKVVTSETKIKKTKTSIVSRGHGKRKRARTQDDDDASSTTSLTSSPEPETLFLETTAPATPTLLTMTKSGRQVLKPTAYNPAAMDAASSRKRTHYGKRTADQALCRKCSRMHSPASNQMVFCDGCNDGWHQLCHDPWISDDAVKDQTRPWFCAACQAKRERQQGAKKQRVEQQLKPKENEKGSWAAKPTQQKRAYLLTLPQQELVGLLMSVLELHPDLPIFPVSNDQISTPRSLFAGTTTEGLFPRADAHPTGQINFVRKIASGNGAAGKRKGSQKEDSQERTNEEDEEFDPLAVLWPRVGMGMYSRLPPDTEDDNRLVDEGDFEAFSGIVYDERGRKVEENGMKV
ncbi:hypothetical protein VTI74DRAFT_3611 [Chaetomium olivicolor]